MPSCDCEYYGRKRTLKVWRYPGVPIPWRLTSKYFDPTAKISRVA